MSMLNIGHQASSRDRSRTPVPSKAPQKLGHQLLGTVKSFNGTWGFLQSPDCSGDIFCHARESPQLNGQVLQPGEAVKFCVVQGSGSERNNGLQATDVQRQGAVGMQEEGEWVIGTLTKVRGSMGFCSVQGIENDVLLGERCLNECGVDLTAMQIGDSITLKMTMGHRGYYATSIQQASPHMQGGQRVLGTLRKFSGGNGFCSVEGVADDVLVGQRSLNEAGINLATMGIGDSLTFEMVMGPKGYHATNIQPAANGRWSHVGLQPAAGMWSPLGERVVGTLKKVNGGWGFCSVEGVADDVLLGQRSLSNSGVDLDSMQIGDKLTFQLAMGPKGYHASNIQQARVVGTLKKIHGGNGFCSVEGVTNDVLLGYNSLSRSGVDLSTMQLGDRLTFELDMGPKGYHAINIQGAADTQPTSLGERAFGKLKAIKGSRGFCTVRGIPSDVLLGERGLADSGVSLETMQLGDTLSFEMACGPKGYHASNIRQEPENPEIVG